MQHIVGGFWLICYHLYILIRLRLILYYLKKGVLRYAWKNGCWMWFLGLKQSDIKLKHGIKFKSEGGWSDSCEHVNPRAWVWFFFFKMEKKKKLAWVTGWNYGSGEHVVSTKPHYYTRSLYPFLSFFPFFFVVTVWTSHRSGILKKKKLNNNRKWRVRTAIPTVMWIQVTNLWRHGWLGLSIHVWNTWQPKLSDLK